MVLLQETEMAGCTLCKGRDVVGFVLRRKDYVSQHDMLKEKKKKIINKTQEDVVIQKNTSFNTHLHKYALILQNVINHPWIPRS